MAVSMNVTELAHQGLKRTFKGVIAADVFDSKLNEHLLQLGKSKKIKGFRQGSANLTTLKSLFAAEAYPKVLEAVIQDTLQNLIESKKLKPALRPKVDIDHESLEADLKKGSDIAYTIYVEERPVVPTIDLAALSFDKPVTEVPQSEIDQAFEYIGQQHRGAGDVKDRPAHLGDTVIIDFDGTLKSGKKIQGGQGHDMPLELGSNTFIAGFEDQLVGARAGDQVTVNVTFPDNYHEASLKGQPAEFAVNVKTVHATQNAAIDDALATKLGFENAEAIRTLIISKLNEERDRLTMLVVRRKILDHFADHVKFEVPEGLVDLEFDAIWQQYQQQLAKDQANQNVEVNADEDRKQYRDIAERRVRLGLILAEIGLQFEVKVSPQQLEQALLQKAQQYPGQEKEAIGYFRSNPNLMESLKAPIYENNVIELIVEKAKINECATSFEDLKKQVEALTQGEDDDLEDAHDHHHVHGPDCNHD